MPAMQVIEAQRASILVLTITSMTAWTRTWKPPGVACRGDTGALLVKRYFST